MCVSYRYKWISPSKDIEQYPFGKGPNLDPHRKCQKTRQKEFFVTSDLSNTYSILQRETYKASKFILNHIWFWRLFPLMVRHYF
jgi:hypothetical protein